jgi:multiple sugar transport system substrate-binding protein
MAENKKLIAAYQKLNPGTTIANTVIASANLETKVLTSFAGGNGPDLWWDGDWEVPVYLADKIIAPFDPKAYGVASQAAFINRYDPHTFDAFMQNGTLYTGGPSEFNVLCLYYNKKIFRELGIPYLSATQPITWEELASIAQKITKISGGKRVRTGLDLNYTDPHWIVFQIEPIVRQVGGELFANGKPLFDSSPVMQVMQYYYDLRFKYQANEPSFTVDNLGDFARGRIGMGVWGIWAVPYMLSANPAALPDIGVAPLPTWNKGGKRVVNKYAYAWYVNGRAAPDVQAAAWKFISYLTSNSRDWFKNCGFMEPIKTNWSYMESVQPLIKVFREDLPYGQYEFRSPHYLELANVLVRAFTAIQGGSKPSSVMKSAQQDALNAVR